MSEPVGLIKIDVEGLETEVLKRAMGSLCSDKPNLIIESEERHFPGALSNVCSLLVGLGYQGMFLAGTCFRGVTNRLFPSAFCEGPGVNIFHFFHP